MAKCDRAHQKRNQQAKAKTKRREFIRTLGVDILWFGLDLWFVWPTSHVAAVWLGILVVALHVATSSRGTRIRVGLVAGLVVAGAVGTILVPPTETEFHGWLLPGDGADPPTKCDFKPRGFVVYCGNSVVVNLPTDTTSVAVISIYDVDLLSLVKEGDRLAVNAKIFDDAGIIAEIVANEFRLNQANMFRADRPDSHTLIVYDRWAAPVIQVSYINPHALWISGAFRYQGVSLDVTPTEAIGPNGLKIGGTNCVAPTQHSGFRLGPIKIVTDWHHKEA